MTQSNLGSIPPNYLARMMQLGSEPERPWRPQELGEILQHQLSTQIELDCPASPTGAGNVPATGATFRDVLCGRPPTLELLDRIKQFAKACRNNPGGPLPPEVATVLYFAAIAAALVERSRRITQLDEKNLREGLEWCAAQAWVEDALRPVFTRALAALITGPK